jgi:hypothetical protein
VIGLLFVCGAVFFAVRAGLGAWGWLGAAGVGATVAAGWWFTYQMSVQAFEPMTVKSMTFTGPSADTLMSVLTLPGSNVDFDIGLVPGVFIGAALRGALWRGSGHLQGFEGGRSMRRYLAGAVLMGFGGMLAGGCAVGAGVTGGSIFALTAWLTLGSHVGGGRPDGPRRRPPAECAADADASAASRRPHPERDALKLPGVVLPCVGEKPSGVG